MKIAMEERGEAGAGAAGAGAAAAQQNSPKQSPTQQQQQQQQQPPFSLPPSTIAPSSNSSPNPNIPFHRPWDHTQQQQTTQYRHFSQSSIIPSSSSTSSPGMAIGVPSPHLSPAPFSSLNPNSFAHRFAPPPPQSSPATTAPQVRLSNQGNQGIGMRGPIGSGPPMRAGGVAMQHQQRPVLQSSVRPQTTTSNQSSTSQNLQVHGMSRGPTVGSSVSPLPVTSQGMQSHNQPWLSSGAPPKPPLPNAPFRAQMNHPQSLQQRSNIPQLHHHSVSMPSQRPQPPSSSQHLQHSLSSEVTQESLGQQIPVPRLSQQQIIKNPGIGNQKPVANSASQPITVTTGLSDKTASLEIVETCNRIVSKRSIQELVAQIDPTERLDSEVEDILVGIAEDFVESMANAACLLAKHRKSTTLEAKDVLLHLDRNWNMTLPGFTGDEIKCFKKPAVNDIHKERLAVLRKSAATGDIVKSSIGQAAGSAKGHLAKTEAAQL